jgi:hypothetical protein
MLRSLSFTTPAFLSALVALTVATRAESFTLTFSAFASEPAADVNVLDATLSLSIAVAGGATGNDLLIVDLANLTAPPDAYTLSAAYLNYTGGADPFGFTLVSDPLGDGTLTAGKITGHGLHTMLHQPHAGGFGYYDLLLDLSGPPGANDGLAAGDSATWAIDLGGTGFTDLDFGILSETPSLHQISGAAALKFTQGPDGDSVFVLPGLSDDPLVRPNSVATVVPEPTSGLLIGAALVGLAWRGRRIGA